MHHQRKPCPIGRRAAKPVSAMVRPRRKELPDQMSARNGLHTIEPALLAAIRRLGIVANNAIDIAAIHLPRDIPMPRLADRRRPHRWQPVPRKRIGPPAKMRNLTHDAGAMPVDQARELLQIRDHRIAGHIHLPAAPARIRRHHRRPAKHRQPDAALRLLLVITLILLRRHAPGIMRRGMRRAHHPITECHMLDPQRPQQRIVGAGGRRRGGIVRGRLLVAP